MSFTKEALQHLEQQAKIGDVVEAADFPAIILSNNTQVQDLEHLQEYRNRFTGTMKTPSINSFLQYIKNHSTDDSNLKCFIDGNTLTANAIFDFGTINQPGHANNMADLTPNKTAEYVALQELTNNRLKQKTLAEFIEDWTHNITINDTTGAEIDNKKAVASIRGITIEQATKIESEVEQFSESMTASQKIEAKAKNGNPQPAWITFTCKPYLEFKTRDFAMRISILTDDNKINLSVKIAKNEEIKQEIATEFKDTLTDKLNNQSVEIYIGKFSI